MDEERNSHDRGRSQALKNADKGTEKLRWDLDSPWAMGSDDYNLLKQHIFGEGPKTIVELGSGNSTFQFACDFPDSSVISLENGALYVTENGDKLRAMGICNTQIMYAPILFQTFCGGGYMTYDASSLPEDITIDCLLVDGPVEAKYPLGREASLYILFDKLSVGAIIGLDDYHRDSARKTVKNWLSVFGDSLSLVEETASFAVLRKTAVCNRPHQTISNRARSYAALAMSITKNTYAALRRRYN